MRLSCWGVELVMLSGSESAEFRVAADFDSDADPYFCLHSLLGVLGAVSFELKLT